MKLEYQSGFGNEFSTEALEGALPFEQNSPQKPAYGLYAEQISGTPFTVPQKSNMRTWVYRILPSVTHKEYKAYDHPTFGKVKTIPTPDQMRWDALPVPTKKHDLLDGIVTMATGGNPHEWTGIGVHRYTANASMENRCFYNADGEMLFVPEQGALSFRTEMGFIEAAPGEIVVIPRGIKFAVDLKEQTARGYICENNGAAFTLPDLGPIGANGLAYPRHFLYPVAAYEDKKGDFSVIGKFDGALWQIELDHSPLDVVAWQGNYAPYKYDLANFMTINTVSFDHADPSIFTVLTSPSGHPGIANIDFVIFPPRWMVAEHTFRPPYFHRNVMNEFMGLIHGVYDAKEGGGFEPGGCSLHNCMSAHGPDKETLEKGMNAELKPVQAKNALAFMFESKFVMRPTEFALNNGLQKDYHDCWCDLPRMFTGNKK